MSLSLIFFFSCHKKEPPLKKTDSTGIHKPKIIENAGDKVYTNIFKDALSSSNHIIIKSGVYRLTSPIYLHDSVVIEGEGKVVLIKDSSYSQVFVNQKAINDFANKWNNSITLKNITIDANNNGTQNDAAHPTANGDLSFKFLENLTLENIRIINGDSILYGIHLQSVKNAIIKNYLYNGEKDACHINGGCKDIIIDGFDISSFDDAFGIMTDDYPRVQHNAQDIRNIVIKNGISRRRDRQSGFFVRFMTGSWEDWEKGNKYKIGNTVNYKNQQYKKVNEHELFSFDCPIHTDGDSLYPDGIVWRYIGKGNNKTSNIYNISISNVRLDDKRIIVRTINKDRYDYGVYPGTENTSIVDSLYIKGHRLYVIRGKVGFKKIIPQRDYFFYFSIGYLIVSPILLIIICFKYFQNRKRIDGDTHSK